MVDNEIAQLQSFCGYFGFSDTSDFLEKTPRLTEAKKFSYFLQIIFTCFASIWMVKLGAT